MPNSRRKNKKKNIHFVFKAHPEGEIYSKQNPRKRVQTHVLENAPGIDVADNRLYDRKNFEYKTLKSDTRQKTMGAFFLKAIEAGKRIMAGESFRTSDEKQRLQEATLAWNRAGEQIGRNPSADSARSYLIAEAKLDEIRHELIKNTVRAEQKPIELRYGSSHSLVSSELRKQGIRSSRSIAPLEFPIHEQIKRRLLRGASPNSISVENYQKAAVSLLLGNKQIQEALIGKKRGKITDSDKRFLAVTGNALINQLHSSDLYEILATKHLSLLLTKNGLDALLETRHSPAYRKKRVTAFLGKHSLFWQRQSQRQKDRKAAKKR